MQIALIHPQLLSLLQQSATPFSACALLLDAVGNSDNKQMVLQVTDGAAAVLMMTRGEAMKRQLPILGIFRSFAAVGVDPAIMGVGPAVAIPEAVKQAGLAIDDIDLFELNEAFASQVTGTVGHVCWLAAELV